MKLMKQNKCYSEDNYSNTRTRRNRDTAQHPLLNWSCSGMLSCSQTPDIPPAQAALSEGKPGNTLSARCLTQNLPLALKIAPSQQQEFDPRGIWREDFICTP